MEELGVCPGTTAVNGVSPHAGPPGRTQISTITAGAPSGPQAEQIVGLLPVGGAAAYGVWGGAAL